MMPSARLHKKNSAALLSYLKENGRDFDVELTSTGFPTFKVGDKQLYVRDEPLYTAFLNKISTFQHSVSQSDLFALVNSDTIPNIEAECQSISDSLLYDGFNFDRRRTSFNNIVRVDISSAYWQVCKMMGLIDRELFTKINNNSAKSMRLKLVGTLGREVRIRHYKNGEHSKTVMQVRKKRRVVFDNIYQRVKKYVDELMMECYRYNPKNFIGFYVDGFWLKAEDRGLLEELKKLFTFKVDYGSYYVYRNRHRKARFVPEGEPAHKGYHLRFRKDDFENYINLHRINQINTNPNFLLRWKKRNK